MLPATIVQWGWCYLAVAFHPNREALDNNAPGFAGAERGERKSQHSTRSSFLDRPGRPGFMPSDAGLLPPVFEKTQNGQVESLDQRARDCFKFMHASRTDNRRAPRRTDR